MQEGFIFKYVQATPKHEKNFVASAGIEPTSSRL